ncbi:VWA domain-containing protein [Alkalimarinus alittae]|uniref:VWA domain-containing protein n=1 Tax=Alkalimarinus alittae TaxID=2961619 RepID=A0ABY6N6T1_9ALTE|nr:VWA domain-containing protein [Alkalimarinus alittae]UZE97799.1 VWA domain-containing protein [Alkalimarinus alittae]
MIPFFRFCLVFIVSVAVSLPTAIAAESAASAQGDVRVLIDISGSMKKNDPNNLRIPAVNLLTEIIPDGSKAGIWTFGQYVNMLVKHDEVNDRWRKNAKSKAKEINSVALYTNIGGALKKSSDDFLSDKTFPNTHFILLTDGMVDIDRDPSKNVQERERILNDIVKGFEDRGAKIHTIALSENADIPLLERMAVNTGGNSAVAETPEALTKAFLQAFNQAVPAEEVPLEGNKFDVDSSIEEFTALIFRKAGSQATTLVGPDEKKQGFENHSEYVKWYRDEGYDLITVKQPLEGEWTIDAELEPDSRVTIVSNLSMKVGPLPTNFYAGDHLDVEVNFLEDGKIVTGKEFLSLLDVKLNIKTEDNKSGTKTISDPDFPPEDGVFRTAIKKLHKVGQYEVNVLVDGKTFKRKHRQVINLRSPFDIELTANGYNQETEYSVIISPRSKNIDIKASSIVAKIKAPDDSSIIRTIPFSDDAQRWELPIENTKGDGIYQVSLKVKGVNSEGNLFKFSPKSFDAKFPRDMSDKAQYVAITEDPEESTENELPSEPEVIAEKGVLPAESEEVPPSEPEAPAEVISPPIEVPETLEQNESPVEEEGLSDTMLWSIIASASALVIALVGGIAYWLFKKRKNVDKPDESEDITKPAKDEAKVEKPEEVAPVEDVPDEDASEPEELTEEHPEPLIEELDIVDDIEDLTEADPVAEVIEEPEPVAEPEPATEPESVAEPEPATEPEPVTEPTADLEIDEVSDLEDIDDLIASASLDDDAITEMLDKAEPPLVVDLDELQDEAIDSDTDLPEGKSADQLVDDILADNEQGDEDDPLEEFNLEDFDIADTEDLPTAEDDDEKQDKT